jgi:ATP-dependent Clp protease ATP-binding subunit ClpA
VFNRYTEKARRVIFFARYEASEFGSLYIETEHLLLGLLREDKTLANRFLHSYEAVDSMRRQIEAHTPHRAKTSTSVDLPLSHESKRILAYGAEESERLGHKHIGTEHLLIGILKEEKSFAAALLRERQVRLSAVREAFVGPPKESPADDEPTRRVGSPIRFERFTEPALRAALLAYQEASQLGSPTIEIEHLLLGVLREDRLEVTLPLRSNDVLDWIRQEIEDEEKAPPDDDLVLTREYQRVLQFACEEADKLENQNVETGHLLLGILNERKSVAAEILNDRGLTFSIVRAELT